MSSPASTTAPKKSLVTPICTALGILITFGFGYLPPIEPITPMGMQVLGIFLGMIFLWSFVSILWPSILGIVALGISDYAPMRKVLTLSFGDSVPILVLFAMLLFGAIQHAGVTRYISRWFLTRRIINGKPVMFSFIFLYATYVLAALSGNVLPIILFMWAIISSVLQDAGYKKGEKYASLMIIGTLFAAISGQAAKPFTGSALMILGSFEKAAKAPIDYLPYMLFGFIMSTLCIVAYCLAIKFIFRPDMGKIAGINIEQFKKEALPPMSIQQKILFASLFGYLGLVLLPSLLPKTLPIISIINKAGPVGVVMLFVVGLTMVHIQGKPILNFKEIAGKYLVWDVFFLVCMAMAISSALTGEGTGITDFLTNMLHPVFGGHSPTLFFFIVLVSSVIITQFANNGVMGVLLMPVLKVFCDQSGSSFPALATLLVFGLHIALLTPAASPYAAVLYGNKEWLTQRDILRYGVAILVLCLFLFSAVGIPLVNLIFQ